MANEHVIHKLTAQLQAQHVEIDDFSWQHAGHEAVRNSPHTQGTHLEIKIVSPRFEGVSLLNRHRMVHEALKEEFETALHALVLKTYTPQEWAQAQGTPA